MKKLIVLLIITGILSFTGCGNKKETDGNNSGNYGSAVVDSDIVIENESVAETASSSDDSSSSVEDEGVHPPLAPVSGESAGDNESVPEKKPAAVPSENDLRRFSVSENGTYNKSPQIHELKEYEFNIPYDNTVYKIKLPTAWTLTLKPDSDGLVYNITNSQKKAGILYLENVPVLSSKATILYSDIRNASFIQTRKYLYSDGAVSFTHVLYSIDKSGSPLYLEFDANEMSISQLSDVFASVYKPRVMHNENCLNYNLSDNISIGVFGNSHIGSADIEDLLKEMLRNTGCTAHVESRGFYSVHNYFNAPNWVNEVTAKYDVIIMSGLYGSDDSRAFYEFANICRTKNIKLVMFPAYNENNDNIEDGYRSNPDVYIADWQRFIDFLIKNNVDSSILYMNDEHKHALPLAGYAGAALVYKVIYGQTPSNANSNSYITRYLMINNNMSSGQAADMLSKINNLAKYY